MTKTTPSVINPQFDGMTDKEVESFLADNNFIMWRKLEDGEWIGLFRLAYTWSVCCGVERITQYKYRWCFESLEEATYMFDNCKDYDDEPEVDHRQTLVGHRYGSRGPRIMLYDKHGFPRW